MRTLLLLAIVAGTAAAEPPKYTRTPAVQVEAKRSERTKPLVAHELPPAAPTVTGADVMLVEEQKGSFRAGQAKILEDLIPQAPDDEKADLMFRLAEIYAKEYRLWRLKAVEATFTKD